MRRWLLALGILAACLIGAGELNAQANRNTRMCDWLDRRLPDYYCDRDQRCCEDDCPPEPPDRPIVNGGGGG